MSGGGKGGKQTTSVQIPKWLESAAQDNIAKANEIAKIGYVPYFGPDVAAFTPTQQAAFANTGAAANAFGMAAPADPMAGMPAPQTFAGGVQGYSSAPMYEQALAELAAARPGQFAALQAPFINPVTGAGPASPFDSGGSRAPAQVNGIAGIANMMLGIGERGGNGGNRATSMSSGSGTGGFGLPDPSSGRISSIGPIGRDGGGGMGRGK